MAIDEHYVVRRCFVSLAVALLVVGAVSGTVLRYVAQITPILLALVLLARRPLYGAYAAIPIFIFWSLIVVLIWLFLLGLSSIANGQYTPIEVALTFVMIGCSVVGAVKSIRLGRALPALPKVLTFLTFAVMQVVVMWVSFLRPVAHR